MSEVIEVYIAGRTSDGHEYGCGNYTVLLNEKDADKISKQERQPDVRKKP